jgi:hypothetical protein
MRPVKYIDDEIKTVEHAMLSPGMPISAIGALCRRQEGLYDERDNSSQPQPISTTNVNKNVIPFLFAVFIWLVGGVLIIKCVTS